MGGSEACILLPCRNTHQQVNSRQNLLYHRRFRNAHLQCHTFTPSEASEAIEEGPEEIVIHKVSQLGEQELATLAESLHITVTEVHSINLPMRTTVTMLALSTERPSFEVIDPTTGHIMMTNDTAIHRAISPDQPDPPPRRGPPGLPFPEYEF